MDMGADAFYFGDSESDSEIDEGVLDQGFLDNLELNEDDLFVDQKNDNDDDDGDGEVGEIENQQEKAQRQEEQRVFKELRQKRKKKKINLAAGPKQRKYHVHADVNVIQIPFANLVNEVGTFKGEPTLCSNCKVALSNTSTLVKKKDLMEVEGEGEEKEGDLQKKKEIKIQDKIEGQEEEEDNEPKETMDVNNAEYVWECEFCEFVNTVDIKEVDVQKDEIRDYVLESVEENKNSSEKNESLVIFVLDISGSMVSTTEISGKFKLKGQVEDDFDWGAYMDQPRAVKKNTTWVSRLQAVQAAVEQQLSEWQKNNKDKTVALILFSNDVVLFNDAGKRQVVSGNTLSDKKKLIEIGKGLGNFESTIGSTYDRLSDTLWKVKPTGATALGPALVIASAVAEQKAGSSIVLCTDGRSNVGLHASRVDNLKTDEDREIVEKWYTEMGNKCKIDGTRVNIITIKGDECSLEDLSKTSEITGGSINQVDIKNLTKNFAGILANPLLAVKVQTKVFLHVGLTFRDAGMVEGNCLVTDIGNVTAESELTFQFAKKSKEVLKKFKGLKALPFQCQIEFTKLDGSRYLRVISKSQKITSNREEAQKGMNYDVLAQQAQKSAAVLADQGLYNQARANLMGWGKVLKKGQVNNKKKAKFSKFAKKINKFDGFMVSRQNANYRDRAYSDSESDEEEDVMLEQLNALEYQQQSSVKKGGLFSLFANKKPKVSKEEVAAKKERESKISSLRNRLQQRKKAKVQKFKKRKLMSRKNRNDAEFAQIEKLKK